MIFENSQDTFVLDETVIPKKIAKVGIKISGGADSALLSFMLAKYVKEERPEITLFPVTGIAENKAYQEIFAKKILAKIEDMLDFKFGIHYVTKVSTASPTAYVLDQQKFTNELLAKNIIEMFFLGITANPTEQEAPHLYKDKKIMPIDDRSKQSIKRPKKKGSTYVPFVNTDKKGIAEHYNRLNLLEDLFPLTRSCEEYTTDFSKHCGKCWFCQEREWGFNKL